MSRHRSGTERSGPGMAGIAVPAASTGGSLIVTLLPVTALAFSAFAMGYLSSAGELLAAGFLCLFACLVAYRVPLRRQAPRSPSGSSEDTDAARHDGPARLREVTGPPPEALPSFGLAVIDRDHHLTWCNDSAAEHLGIDARRGIGRPLTHLVGNPSLAAYLAAGHFAKPLRIRAAEQGEPVLSVQFAPYVDGGWLLVSRNITRAARLESARRECIANVSHELRTPLTVLAGFLETVRELRPDHHMSRDCLDLMEEQCRRMQRIIADLLQLSALESAPEPPGDERVSVGRLLARVRSEAEVLSGSHHRIVLEADEGFDLLGTESEIASAFGNLASNAVRYTAPGGRVRLVWRASPAGAEFTVEDTGIGIDRKHIPRLTDRFYCVDRDRSRRSGGTGLGLAIVKQALSRHQAALEIESEPGKGSRFTARFPAHRVIRVVA